MCDLVQPGRLALLGLVATFASACDANPPGTVDGPCGEAVVLDVSLGEFVDEEFVPFAPGRETSFFPSPQGGFGVLAVLEVNGVGAPDGSPAADLEIDVYLEDEHIGRFELTNAPLGCQNDGTAVFGGLLITLDQDRYATHDDLEQLDGKVARFVPHAKDPTGREATGEVSLTLRAD